MLDTWHTWNYDVVKLWVGFSPFFQAYLWWGFLSQRERSPVPTFTIAEYVIGALYNTGLIVLLVRRRQSLRIVAPMLVITASTLIVNFSYIYWSHGTAQNSDHPLTQLDAIFMAMGILSTAGTGDLVARSQWARGMQTLQMTVDILFVLLAVAVVVGHFLAERTGGGSKAGDPNVSHGPF